MGTPYRSSIITLLALVFAASAEDAQKQDAGATTEPVEAFKALVASFPKQSARNISAEARERIDISQTYDITDVSFDVKKTDSLVSPIVGVINFTTIDLYRGRPVELDMQMTFNWQEGRWKFSRLLNRENGIDFTNTKGGEEMMGAGEMLEFLKPLR
jgi:hypothetical protein